MLERLQIEEHSILPASDCLLLATHPCPSPPATPTGVPGSCTNHPPPRSQLQTPHALSAGLPGGEAEGVGGGRRHHPAMGKMESSPHPAEALLHPQDLPAPGDGFSLIFSSTDLERHSAVEIRQR